MTRFCSREDYETMADVENAYPGAADIAEVEEGWMVFDTIDEADTWARQV